MKKLLMCSIAALLLFGGAAFAQDQQTALPKAGLTPENPFYFLDKLGEALQEFFTFNPEGKARLQITFAAERIAEIKIVLETKGVEAKGLDIAQLRLQAHLAKAADIVTREKGKGKDVSELAKELDDKFEGPKSALEQTFEDQEEALEAREEELKVQLRVAHRAGDTALEEALAAELGQVKAQLELLELRKEDIEDELEAEEERIEEEIEDQQKAAEAIREAEEEKQELIEEAAEEGVELPADAFVEFDSLVSQAQAAFDAGNYQEARQLAKQAEELLEEVEDTVEKLEEMMEAEQDAQEAIQDAEEELAELQAEAQEQGVRIPPEALAEYTILISQAKNAFAAEKYKEAEEFADQAEESLDEAEEMLEEQEEEAEALQKQEEEEEEEEEELTEEETEEVESELEAQVMLGGNDVLGTFLAGSNGMTLYTFKKDEPSKSNCYGDCALNWPPLSVDKEPIAGNGVRGSLGVIDRDDGIQQATYNGWPLYFWVNDLKPGDANGHGVKGFWSVVRP